MKSSTKEHLCLFFDRYLLKKKNKNTLIRTIIYSGYTLHSGRYSLVGQLSETGEGEKGRKQNRDEVKWNLQGSLTNKKKDPGQSFLNAFLLRSLYRNIHFLREEVNEKKVHFFYYNFNKKISHYLISLVSSSKTKAKITKADTAEAKKTQIISWLQLHFIKVSH